MVSYTILLWFVLVHWFADFVLQSDWQAQNKSSRWDALLGHTFTYSVCMLLFGWMMFGDWIEAIAFSGVTFIAHTVTDYITSRIVKGFFGRKDYHNGFVVVGFDQILHYAQLLLTYYCIVG